MSTMEVPTTTGTMEVSNQGLLAWVNEMAKLTKPDRVVWCDGSEQEKKALTEQAVAAGILIPLNPQKRPGCYLHRSNPNDVARVEHLTFICTPTKDEAGPTNNWMAPDEAYAKLGKLFDGSMKGRTMYVIPYVMGPLGSPYAKIGVELTDSVYVALNMGIMTRMGKCALDMLGDGDGWNRGLHSTLDLNPERRFICHFPQDNTIWSVGSGYGGNVLLGKKCLALRIGSYLGRNEGWLAEHMLILGVQAPGDREPTYVAAAFPSACGKTNFAMMIPPKSFAGWKIWTVGDDIAWMRVGPDGRLWAINPEAGYFGVAPGTSSKSNPNAMESVAKNTLFTNVAMTPDGDVWWEGIDGEVPEELTDWKGNPWKKGSTEKAAHPNSRFTAPMTNNPALSAHANDPQGVPISAIIFGGRRARLAPLVFETRDWAHGVFAAATMGSETTAAATGAVGVVRRDPMAMLPFCGYNMADYFGHWLKMGALVKNPPKIFHVNWFRQDDAGRYIWPGFGENLRPLLWMIDRVNGKGGATETVIGAVPTKDSLNLDGLDISAADLDAVLSVDHNDWKAETPGVREFFDKFEGRVPKALYDELDALEKRLG